MSAPPPIPTAVEMHRRLAVLERELLLMEQSARGMAGMVTAAVFRIRELESLVRPFTLGATDG